MITKTDEQLTNDILLVLLYKLLGDQEGMISITETELEHIPANRKMIVRGNDRGSSVVVYLEKTNV